MENILSMRFSAFSIYGILEWIFYRQRQQSLQILAKIQNLDEVLKNTIQTCGFSDFIAENQKNNAYGLKTISNKPTL